MAKIFRNYNTLSQFNSESVHPENKICFIKDNGVLYSNGVQYSPYKMDTISNIGDSDSIVDKFNELRKGLLKSNLMVARTPYTIIYWTGDSTIKINGTSYTAQADKVNIDGVEYYQLKLDKYLDNDFYKFNNNNFTNLIFKNVDIGNVTNMDSMFYGCSSLTSLDLSTWHTSNVTCMNYMFHNCSSLTSLDVSKFDTSNVTYMVYMFYGCSSLTSLDVSKFDTSKVTDMHGMFYNCSALTSLDVSKFDTSKVTDMPNMFNSCRKLTSLDLSGWDTSKVTNMDYMFYYCRALTSLDISGWDISNVTGMNNMFYYCRALKTIRMVGCSQTTIDKIKAQLSTDGITGCTIVTE